LEFQCSYTFSRSIDNTSYPNLDSGSILGNQLAARSDRGLSDFDRTQRFVGYFLWELPKLRFAQDSKVGHLLISDWRLSGIVTAMSGAPVDLVDPAGGSLYGLVGGARPNWAAGANRKTATTNIPSGYYFNPSAFVVAAVPPGQAIPSAHDPLALTSEGGTDLGNVGRNLLRGPRQSDFDLSVGKRFSFAESRAMEFQVDFFNLLNHANRDLPVGDISTSDFGRIVSFSSSPRIVQLSLKLTF
jgi:hypothetical protein